MVANCHKKQLVPATAGLAMFIIWTVHGSCSLNSPLHGFRSFNSLGLGLGLSSHDTKATPSCVPNSSAAIACNLNLCKDMPPFNIHYLNI